MPADPPTTPYCENCRFWVPNDDTNTDGTCHRHAPRVVAGTWGIYLVFLKATSTEWPDTVADEWCGEHEPVTESESNSVLPHDED